MIGLLALLAVAILTLPASANLAEPDAVDQRFGAASKPIRIPQDPEIVDRVEDTYADVVPFPAADVELAWFEADEENLYIGLKVADIPPASAGLPAVGYSVFFMPEYPVADPHWGGTVPLPKWLLGVRAYATFAPVHYDADSTVDADVKPVFEVDVVYHRVWGRYFAILGNVEGRIDPVLDVVWWEIPLTMLQSPEPGALLTGTYAISHLDVARAAEQHGDTSDTTGFGRDYVFR